MEKGEERDSREQGEGEREKWSEIGERWREKGFGVGGTGTHRHSAADQPVNQLEKSWHIADRTEVFAALRAQSNHF